ncbi:TPA: hypothetical protein VCA04_001202 [Streptococcus suis]|nr:hypothetical protein [Streptococcus suis]HEL2164421.1 hypothetical protein [Streptococcus suis]HEM2714254.1 hypothetical protein [Streptococcus suis]HEP1783019.1 hypothetical protein [Streptococcus suis]
MTLYKFGDDVYDKYAEQYATFEGYANNMQTVAILTTGMSREETYLRAIEHIEHVEEGE